jgi:hypothetical protein
VFNAIAYNLIEKGVLELLLAERYNAFVAIVDDSRSLWTCFLAFQPLNISSLVQEVCIKHMSVGVVKGIHVKVIFAVSAEFDVVMAYIRQQR